MPDLAYERFRAPLAALADDAWVRSTLAHASLRPAWNGDGAWKRAYARFEPAREPFAALVLESAREPHALAVLEAFAHAPETAGPAIPDVTVGWIRLRPFWSDPGLPSLCAVLSRPGRPRVVRYRPQRQCTIRFDGRERPLFAKVFPDERGRRIHAEGRALWEAGARGELAFRVARPVRWDAAERTLWQDELGGDPIADRLRSEGGPALAERIGRALASLAQSRVVPALRNDGQAQLAQSARVARELCRQVPRLRSLVTDILDRIARLHRRSGPRDARPVHGAPHAHQWLDDGGQLGLLDFDGLCLGDPERDVATVLAEMDFENTARVPVAEINHRLLAGYESAGGVLHLDLLAAYRAHKRLEKARKTLRAVRSDGDRRAERRCAYAAALLEGIEA